ncbi:MAG: VOC family protein [Oscillospiraceae bacterium]|nr:VOC family protein [Oscillospiraceae bacterium]
MNGDLAQILRQARFTQVGMVVRDLDASKRQYALLFGCPEPDSQDAGSYDVTRTQIQGQPAPGAGCRMAFFNLSPGVQLELIEPNDQPSVWRDHLDQYGEGIHHLAFSVDQADPVIRQLQETFGARVEQEGHYADGSGRYTYLDLQAQLKCRIELLESFN